MVFESNSTGKYIMNAKSNPLSRCTACGAELSPNLPSALCPKCLLNAGMTPGNCATLPYAAPAQRLPSLPKPGEQFGRYRIIRQVGMGGMGAVFEAEDFEQGRRLALKIMSHALDSRDTRARFLREGRLAASINHPNSVYIFGTEEIAGMPVITMEFVTGGTLQDLVKKSGPLAPTPAVDYILQIIAGLEAAQRVGVLHRDVKPSNCFLEPDGRVKIGDFGLSINTAIKLEQTLTTTGAFMGTPAFASPEQLRGDELSVRSDIYAVGITLYYLLTGALPFDAPNLPQLLASILERPAESPVKKRAAVPEGLAQVVLRCLQKNPDERYKNYDELRRALVPYSSIAIALAPASLSVRSLAFIFDSLIIFPVLDVLKTIASQYFNLQSIDSLTKSLIMLLLVYLYFALMEGLLGATAGKFFLGLRVMRLNRDYPGFLRALGRFAIFNGLTVLVPVVSCMDLGFKAAIITCLYAWSLLMFVTIRRRNGWAAIHDLLTGTRVIRKSECPVRGPMAATQAIPPAGANLPGIGPYQVLASLPTAADGHAWFLGYDTCLLRKVWIRKMKPDDPPVVPELKNLGRPGRLRWLNGKRAPGESWDAYEALAGQPLVNLMRNRQTWDNVRFWLLDLAKEFQTAQEDGTMPKELGLERVWIAENHARILDFPVPGVAKDRAIAAIIPQDFMLQVAISALTGRPVRSKEAAIQSMEMPVALHAKTFLAALPKFANLQETIASLDALIGKHKHSDIVTRMQRLLMAIVYAIVPFSTLAGWAIYLLTNDIRSVPLKESGIELTAFFLLLQALFALGLALFFCGGPLIHMTGLVIVNRRGARAARLRVFGRACITVLPAILLTCLTSIIAFMIPLYFEFYQACGLFVILQVILTIISLVLPDRSLQDRLAGTWLVPR